MKVTKISYEKLVNTGDYEHERYGIEIEIDENDEAQAAIDKAKQFVQHQIQSGSEMYLPF
jgi:hypothetical protein